MREIELKFRVDKLEDITSILEKNNCAISKVINDYGDKRMYVISGKGYGIIDDCGGIYGLYEIFNKINNDWGEYDINNFDLDKANSFIDYYI